MEGMEEEFAAIHAANSWDLVYRVSILAVDDHMRRDSFCACVLVMYPRIETYRIIIVSVRSVFLDWSHLNIKIW